MELPTAENSILYREVIDRNYVTEEHLKSGIFEVNPGQRDIM
jgi:hypothetical protein